MEAGRSRYDLAVIGAGVNGAGIARDAALRGLSVIVLERADVCSGTSWASSRLIHGGLRYLEYGEVPLVFESLRERRNLRRIAPHLIRPLSLCIPIYESARRGRFLIRLGLTAYDLLSIGKSLPGHEMLSKSEALDSAPGLEAGGLRGAARYFDAQVTYAERLVLENLLAARDAGARIATYAPVISLETKNDETENDGLSLVYHDSRTWQDRRVEARVVVNAAGPWVDEVLASSGKPSRRLIGGTKGSHIVVGRFDGAPGEAFYVEAESDGRPFFILPWNGMFLIGTTDIRYDGDPADTRASSEEVEYLLSETNRVFPSAGLTTDDVFYTYSGVRPLPYHEAGPESAITRRHIVTENREIGAGLLSIVGGKLTTYRELAEQTVDRVAKRLGKTLPACRTHDSALPGASGIEEARRALTALGVLREDGVERLLSIYGGRAAGIAGLAESDPAQRRLIGDGSGILAAELTFVARQEMPHTLADIVYRRTMLGLAADQGRGLYPEIAGIAAAELGWDAARKTREIDALSRYSDSLRVV